MKDVEFVVFKRQRGSGGQHANKTSTSIRATHLPTGVKVEACKERSQTANKKAAIESLQAKLDQMLNDQILEDQKKDYQAKAEAAFGSQIRTYRLCGSNQVAVDHRTGVARQTQSVLEGNIDEFIISNLKLTKGQGDA